MNYDLNLAPNGIKTGVFLFKPSVCLCSGFGPEQYHLQREKQFWLRNTSSHEAALRCQHAPDPDVFVWCKLIFIQ